MTVPPAGDAREEFVADMEGTMQGALTGSDPSLEGDVEVDLAQINGNPIRARRPRAMQTTVLTFLSTLTRGFDSDFEAIQDEFTKTVQSAFTIENVANALQTPELTNKYGDFIVTEAETDGSIETLSPTAAPTRKNKKSKSKSKSEKFESKISKSKKGKSKESKKGKEGKSESKASNSKSKSSKSESKSSKSESKSSKSESKSSKEAKRAFANSLSIHTSKVFN